MQVSNATHFPFPRTFRSVLGVWFGVALLSGAAWAGPVYVNQNAPGPAHDGASWGTAFLTIQKGVDAAYNGEVWVSSGIYYENVAINGYVRIYGGFAGSSNDNADGETVREQRNPAGNVTTIAAPGDGRPVTITGPQVTIDGFTITDGTIYDANREDEAGGGGVYCTNGPVTISNNVIKGNFTGQNGSGGGISFSGQDCTIVNNVITGNTSADGGGIFCDAASGLIANNVISGNMAADGGGMFVESGAFFGPLTISGNLVSGNQAGLVGGLWLDTSRPNFTISNNTIAGNTDNAPAYGSVYCLFSTPALANNIIAFNSSGIARNGSAPSLSHNDVYGNAGGNYVDISVPPADQGNISVDPLFADRLNGDYRIQINSPAVNSGDPTVAQPLPTDVYGGKRIQDGRVDIGAYEFPAVGLPTFDPIKGVSATPITVILNDETPGADIHYTLNGTDPTAADPSVAPGGSVTIVTTSVLKAKAFKEGIFASGIATGVYQIGSSWVDAYRALSIAGGLTAAASTDQRLNVEKNSGASAAIDIRDALRLVRRAAGLDPN